MAPRTEKRFTETLAEIRGGDVITDATQQLREVVQRVRDTGRPGSLTLTLKIKSASKGAGSTLIIEDDIKVKLPVAEKGTTVLYANEDGTLSDRDPRQPKLPEMAGPARVLPMADQERTAEQS